LKLTAWRIVQAKHAGLAFRGDGARLYGGRWNLKGTPIVYTAGSLALAALELLVHLESLELLEEYVSIPIEFDKRWCQTLDRASLPHDWLNSPASESTKNIGTNWVREGLSSVLEVPSVLIQMEMNFLINPQHPDFARMKIGEPSAFHYDSRLLKLR
jgi:RES domain-containing protein